MSKQLARRFQMKLVVTILAAIAIAIMFSGQAMADPGGQPAAHGLEGKDFGQATSGLAQSEPGAVKDHKGAGSAGGGKPAAHWLEGKDFGQATSGLAQSEPGAVKNHKDQQTGN